MNVRLFINEDWQERLLEELEDIENRADRLMEYVNDMKSGKGINAMDWEDIKRLLGYIEQSGELIQNMAKAEECYVEEVK